MTEPWERIKMALAEAGRPEMADRIGPPPGTRYSYCIPRGWFHTLTVADQKILYRAQRISSPTPNARLCFSCWADRADRAEDDLSRCEHV